MKGMPRPVERAGSGRSRLCDVGLVNYPSLNSIFSVFATEKNRPTLQGNHLGAS